MKSYDSVLLYKTCYADRVSYVIAPNGSIVYEYSSMYPEKHVSKTLQALEQWGRQEKEVISKVLQN